VKYEARAQERAVEPLKKNEYAFKQISNLNNG
jgi:hypothetical protein